MKLMPLRADDLSPYPAVNLFTEPDFLHLVARVYHPGRRCRVIDHVVDGQVFRLLEVEGVGTQTSQRFIDMHEAVGPARGAGRRLRTLPRLHNVAQPSIAIEAFLQRPGLQEADGAPTTLWRDFPAWSDYLALLNKHLRVADLQRRGRRLAEKVGPLEFRVDDRSADVLPTSLAWRSHRDLSLGRPDMFEHPPNQRFFHELHERGWLRASTLRGGGRLLAAWLGALHDGRWSGWIFTFNPDPDLKRYSLGHQLLLPMLESSHAAGHREFDFSIGLEPYKLKYATHVRPLSMAGLPSVAQRAAGLARRWLAGHPVWHERARGLRRRFTAHPDDPELQPVPKP